MFFALGLEPEVSQLVNRRVPRGAAVTLVIVLAFGVLAGAVAAAIPPLLQEAHRFIEQVPQYLQEAQNHSTVIGRINERFHVRQRITDMIHSSGTPAVGNIVKAGETVFGAVSRVGVVAVLTVYFLADMRRFRATVYRFVPNSRRRGFVVAMVALTVSIPVSIATVAFYIAFRLAEDYLLTPRIIGRAVRCRAVSPWWR